MKELIALTLLATSIGGFAQEGRTHKHCFAPKGFYRYHDEEGYKYKTYGAGIEYSLYRPEGINVKISAITNFDIDSILVETETSLFYRIPLHSNHNIYPVLSTRGSSHQIEKMDMGEVFINKSTVFGGMGWELIADENLRFSSEISLFRDLHNAVMGQDATHFWGQKYSNPSGFKAKLGVTTQWHDQMFFDIEGFYAQTIQKCYKEIGIEAAFKWGF